MFFEILSEFRDFMQEQSGDVLSVLDLHYEKGITI